MHKGTSETLRENIFNFIPYYDYYKNTSFLLPDINFFHGLSGLVKLTEGGI
jgi:hypothetical protein